MTRQDRIKIVNEIIKEIADRGRRFFYSEGNYAELFERKGRVYYKTEWARSPVKQICLSVPDYRRSKNWWHGGTLWGLVKDFRDFIKTGEYSNHNNGYGGLYCPHWGYSEEDMKAIRQKAIELGYLIEGKTP
jgi:hypothetical protein